MFRNIKLTKNVIKKINRAADHTLEALSRGRVQHEPQVTDRLIGAIERELDNTSIGGVIWQAKTLTDRVRNSQESEFGADFMGVLSLTFDDFEVHKGFLSQAKRIEPSQSFLTANSKELKKQCKKMLSFSVASFVFLYSQQSGICVVPAIDILGARNCNPHELTSKSIGEFFKDHIECFIGDHTIQSPSPEGLNDLLTKYSARSGIYLRGIVKEIKFTKGKK